ncbi:ATP-dependent DNA helicase [Aquabacterium soli]|uniref:DNA 5'-3' helicase n=1 Tax=Aquabacterium soli TaxID=2493092 RepID=A0A3R8U1H3_9BURK|nr:ATP-dependent DNA helicase [Aquabacterium soli]RRS02670.1 ATP-dependent DNA helicase [Aquabacterium soli]
MTDARTDDLSDAPPETPAAQADPLGLRALFAADGPLARALPGYRVRPQQVEMAQAIAIAIRESSSVVLEAGTGVGKTAAYLVPALLQGGKVIVSTGTKALQDQLFNRDLPNVRDALALPLKAALLKGRSNYLCWHHLERTNQEATQLGSRQEVRDLGQINRFIHLTPTGDKAECAAVPETASIWMRVTSTRENCLGSECGHYNDCFVLKARREAQDADVVVVNHHLFFADLMLREEGVPELLPNAQTVIFDEAHQLPDTATMFFGDTVSSAQLMDLLRDTKAIGLAHARDALHWPDAIAPTDLALKDLRLCFDAGMSKWSQGQLPPSHPVWKAVDTLRNTLRELRDVLDAQSERSPDLANLHRRANDLMQRLCLWGHPERADQPELCWLDVSQLGVQLHRTPISVADVFRRQRLGDETGGEAQSHEDAPAWADDEEQDAPPPDIPPRKAWIFTSATLAVRQDFSHFQEALGLQDAQCQAWSSPYDYPSQAMLYVPQQLPLPTAPGHTDAVVDAALPLIIANGGRAFLLCTSHRAVQRAAERLKQRIEAEGLNLSVLTQGDAPRPMLLDDFRRLRRAVLVGSHSFWEGIDVKGDALTLVIIDKLPFAPPDDPVLAKRLELLEQSGGNPFMEHQVPQAIIALKQGAGRLIRSETDHGVLMICDTRLIDKPYGRRIWQSLPPMRRSRVQAEAVDFLMSLKQQASA